MGILIIHIDDKDAGCGRFFQHFWVHQTFQMVERDVPPDIGRRMGGVSRLFAPLKLCSPPTTEDEKNGHIQSIVGWAHDLMFISCHALS